MKKEQLIRLIIIALIAVIIIVVACIVIWNNNSYSFSNDTTSSGELSRADESNSLSDDESTTGKPVDNTAYIAPNACDACIGSADPYASISADDFYSDYKPACCNINAGFRTKHGFMSGSIADQDQNPSFANDMPKKDGSYIKNITKLYSEDGNTYTVLNSSGSVAYYIFKDGAYVTLDEVAAYVFAFGDIPPNYLAKKSASPSSSVWGKFLRLNHSHFTCNISKYPYEPALPDSQGLNAVKYYEIDIGTTGTDCDPQYDAVAYNNGQRITRGAARIVYARFDANGNNIVEPQEKYVFYTNNHYNDFREYLNCSGGWGEIFGNVTGGGTISSKTDYSPTDYIPVVMGDIRK